MGGRLPVAALAFAIAAALASWTPLAAPLGVLVGVGAAVLSVLALRRGARRRAAIAALVIALLAIVASGLVVALTAGVGRELRGAPVVTIPDRADVRSELDQAAERTRAARERARSELDALDRTGPEGDRDRREPPPEPRR